MSEKHARILLVEDDEDDYIIAKDSLEDFEDYIFQISWVSNPNDALEQLKYNAHDICLLDYKLGAQTGLTVLKQATSMGCRVPIIMLTGQSDKVLDKAALDAGAIDFIVKSELDSPRFARAIRYALARQDIENARLERVNLENQSRYKDQFLAHLSHELRTPLTSILGYTELLLGSEKGRAVSPELNIILNNGRHLLSLLNDVLDLSKIAAQKLELSPSLVNLNNFLVDVYTLMQVTASDKGIDLHFESATPLPEQVYVDPTRLRQILINLVNNAIKFTQHGSVKVLVSAHNENELYRLKFDITDTGQGIPEEKLGKIFQPFEQVEDTVSRKEMGAGLGLAISSELASKLGGEISVVSTLNQGSCFSLTIRCEKTQHQELAHFSLTRDTSRSIITKVAPLSGHVLIVDDITEIRILVGHIVSSFGLTIELAENGKLALEKVAAKHYDVILMDIHMPEMDGKEAVVAIRNQGFTGQILALTAATMKGVKESLQKIGFDNVISKPVDKMILYRCLAQFLLSDEQHQSGVEQQTKGNEQQQPCFMLVEDDVDAAEITKLLLESLGVSVKVAHSMAQCQVLLDEQDFWDKILLDFHLPDGNGLELANHIFSNHHVGEIVIVSGAELELSVIKQSGCNRALLKPLNKQKLLSLVEQ